MHSGIKLSTLARSPPPPPPPTPAKPLTKVFYWCCTVWEIPAFVPSVMGNEDCVLVPVKAIALLGGTPSSQGLD